MKYLKISNKGELDIRLISLMGASTKRSDNSKIGQFGTGLKYSIAWILRNNIDFRAFVGSEEIKFTVKNEEIGGQDFGVVHIDGQRSSLTIQMGMDWMGWMIVRELYCNAKDEGVHEVSIVDQIDNGIEGSTTFYLQLIGEIKETYENWNDYFLDSSKALQNGEEFAIYPGGKHLRVYKNGILVGDFPDEKRAIFSYDLKKCQINELRSYSGYLAWDISRIIGKFTQKNIESLIQQLKDDKSSNLYESELDYSFYGVDFEQVWLDTLGKGTVISFSDYSNLESRGLLEGKGDLIALPDKLAKKLCQQVPHLSAVRIASEISSFYEVHNQALDKRIKEGIEILSACGYEMQPELTIITGVFGDPGIFGMINISEKVVMLSDELMKRDNFMLLTTLVEENEHMLSGLKDCTRQFQQHFIDLYVKSLMDKGGIRNI